MNNTLNRTARRAGSLYLVVILLGIFHLMYVPSQLHDWSSAAHTFTNIVEHNMLFRLGIVAGIVGYVAFLILPLVLYQLLSDIDKPMAVAMVALAVISVPLEFVNMLNKFSVLTLVSNADYLRVLEPERLQAQVLFYLDNYNDGIQLASVFWGLWLFPFGHLVYRSGFLPKALGILLIAGSFGYVFNFLGNFLSITYRESGLSPLVTAPASLGEIGICLWMLIAGAKEKRVDEV